MRSLVLLLFAVSIGAQAQCTFTLMPGSAQVSSDTNTGSFSILASQSNCPRTASSSASWITVTFGQSGTGNGSVGYRVDANTTYATRAGTISVGNAVFNISQAALPCPPISFTPTGQAVQPAGGAFPITVTSPCGWNASSDSAWIMLQISSGAGSGVLTYTVAPNNTGQSRSGNILIGPNKFPVVQSSIDCSFTVSPLTINVPTAGASNQVGIQVSNNVCPWTAQNSASWITGLSPVSGTGNGTVSFTVTANTGAQPRSATLTIAGQAVTVTQAGNVCTFTFTPSSIDVPYAATTGAVSLAASLSNCPWTATPSANWIAITSGLSGSVSGNIGYAIAVNPGLKSRSGAISVNGASFNITQDACASPLTFAPSAQTVPAAGGNFTVAITTACTWAPTTPASWISLNLGSGTTGNGTLSYTVAPNITASSRTSAIQVNGAMFTVTEAGISSTGNSISVQSVVNGASFLSGPLAPGELISIFGTGLGPTLPAGLQTSPDGATVTNSLAGTRVLFDGMPAPLTYVSATQVNAIVPFELDGAVSTKVVVEVLGLDSTPAIESVAPSSPAIFAVAGGKGQGAILNQDSSPNSTQNPAALGSVLQVFATGIGQTSPAGSDGLIAGAMPVSPALDVTATVGGIDAPVQYAGSSNGLVAGVTQINVQIPPEVQPGSSVPVVLNVGGVSSVSTISVAVH